MPKNAKPTKEIAEMLDLYKRAAERLDEHQNDPPPGRMAKRSRDRLVRRGMRGSKTRPQ
jgi:hypothetical protein